jgi:prephenate dehydrogenase
VAGGNPVMWRDIFATNQEEIAVAARLLATELGRVASALESGDSSAAMELLEAAREALGKD